MTLSEGGTGMSPWPRLHIRIAGTAVQVPPSLERRGGKTWGIGDHIPPGPDTLRWPGLCSWMPGWDNCVS